MAPFHRDVLAFSHLKSGSVFVFPTAGIPFMEIPILPGLRFPLLPAEQDLEAERRLPPFRLHIPVFRLRQKMLSNMQ